LLGLFRREDPARKAACLLQRAIAARSRETVFYSRFGVTDNIDGRFDLFTLHAFVVMEALKEAGGSQAVGQHLANYIFASFEEALRELGVADAGLSRRIKAMANAFYGRLAAYAAAKSEHELADALGRNLYRGQSHSLEAPALAHYMRVMREQLRRQNLSIGDIDFGPLPEFAKENASPS
jgi:cytochrome b pre-mRNA-processing protein 3